MSKPFKIGIISGSQRPVQAGMQITNFVQGVIEKHLGPKSADFELHRINIRDLKLPLYDEPGIPQTLTSSEQYANETTRAWSRTVAPLDAFVIVTPEYNINLPAGLKNAIDVLWHEWTTKPFMIVSYGIQGGTFSYEGLKRALTMAIKAHVVDTPVNLAYGHENMFKAAGGEDLGLSVDREDSLWADQRPNIRKAWDELIALLQVKGKN